MSELTKRQTGAWGMACALLFAAAIANGLAWHREASHLARRDEVLRNLAAEATRIEGALRLGMLEDSRLLAPVLEQLRQQSRCGVVWVRLLNERGEVQAQAGTLPRVADLVAARFPVRLPRTPRTTMILLTSGGNRAQGFLEIAARPDSRSRRRLSSPTSLGHAARVAVARPLINRLQNFC